MKKTFHIVGAGRVGQTLARHLQVGGGWQLAQICGGHQAALLADHCGGEIVPCLSRLSAADVVWLTTPDSVIAGVAQAMAALPWLTPDTLVLHCSGAQSAAVLAPLAERGVLTGSLHPVLAFADVETALAALPGSLCALEAGQDAAMPVLHALAEALGMQAFEMPSEHKARYHAALSAASNFSVALAAFAQTLLQPLTLPETLSRQLVAGLMRQSVANLSLLPPELALTGPIVRGDDGTVAAHLAVLNDKERAQYCAWATPVLALALASGRLDPAAAARLAALLEAAPACGNDVSGKSF
ncbi:MAG: DUF2520 domain-containing protein [Neisseria sp.]|nr:DUF2520 domain-containing protein [Neisseria sp.]